jgi:hypothetical protein
MSRVVNFSGWIPSSLKSRQEKLSTQALRFKQLQEIQIPLAHVQCTHANRTTDMVCGERRASAGG